MSKRKNPHLQRELQPADPPARFRVRYVELEAEGLVDDRQLELFASALGAPLGVDFLELEHGKRGGR